MTSYADQNRTSLSLGAAKCETVATFVGSWQVQRSRVIRKSDLGAANCETVASFVGSWEAQRSRVIRKSE